MVFPSLEIDILYFSSKTLGNSSSRAAWILLLTPCSFSPLFSRALAENRMMMDSPPKNSRQRVGSI
jgi:hypothetical protein